MEDKRLDKALKEIPRNEAQRKVWAYIHQELHQARNPNTTTVEVPQSDGTTRECVTKEKVKEAIGGETDTRSSKADLTAPKYVKGPFSNY